jgi:glycosyltransferase involved in cell wall biosynthesis
VSATPRVTILTTVFNGERFLGEAIESVLAQDYRDFEHVIVDDGSTDASAAIVERFAKRDSRIVLVRLPENRGVGYAANRGLDVARGEYIARLDSDDVTLPGRFVAQIDALDRDPALALVATHYEIIDERGRVRRRLTRFEDPPVIDYLLNFTNPLGAHSQTMFRRDAARYDEAHFPAADYDFLTRVGKIAVLPIVGVRYRVHGAQITARMRPMQRRRVLEIAQVRLSRYLDRAVSFDEINAVRSVFGWSEAPSRAEVAQRVLEEAFARFCELHSDYAGRVRAITARRWLNSARHEPEKARRVLLAMRWWSGGLSANRR